MSLDAFGVVLRLVRRRVSVMRLASGWLLDFRILAGGESRSIADMISEPDSVGRSRSAFLMALRRSGDAG